MLEIFVYPVSGILKVWHLLFASFFDSTLAWTLAIVFLVFTVRGIIAPLNWLSVKSGRIGALMRPEQTEISERLTHATTVEEAVHALEDRNELHERYKFNPAVGCLPIFIIIPAFLGLYRVVLHVAGTGTEAIGLLTLDDVASFRATTVFGVPLTDYAREHHTLILPMLIAALLFTFLNTLITLYRSFLTTEFHKKLPRRLLWFMALTIVLIPWMLWSVAWNGPIPVAIIFYWGCTYLFTLAQTVAYEYLLRRRYPLPDAVHEMRRESIRRWRSKEKPAKLSKEEKAAAQAARRENARIQAEARKQIRSNNRPEEQKEAE